MPSSTQSRDRFSFVRSCPTGRFALLFRTTASESSRESPSRNGGGMGLRIMQYRAGVIDATLEVRRRAGHGTAVVCQIKNQARR